MFFGTETFKADANSMVLFVVVLCLANVNGAQVKHTWLETALFSLMAKF